MSHNQGIYNQGGYNANQNYDNFMQPQFGKNQYQMVDPQEQQPQTCNRPPMPNNVNFGSENIMIDSMLQNQKPTAPTLLYSIGDQTYGLPVKYVHLKTDFHIGTMFGLMHIVFTNNTPNKVSGTLAFPLEGTVTDADIKIGDGRFVGTTYVDSTNAQKHLSGGRNRGSGVADNPNDRFIPDLFRCPINRINPGEDVIIDISFMQSVEYLENRYQFTLPLTFGPNILPAGVNYSQVVYIETSINCLTANIQYGSGSHSMMLQSHMNNVTSLVAAPLPQNQSSVDFHFAYTVEKQVVTSVTIVTPPEQDSYDTRQSFVTFVNPPSTTKSCAPRDIIFLVDRSGSMAGQPWQNSAMALSAGLGTLHDGDRFGIVCFDHEASFFNGTSMVGQPNVPPQFALYNYNMQVAHAAKQFINANPARGGTNIRTPLVWAIDTLIMNKEAGRIPFVILVTDGAVRDEREIVQDVVNKREQEKSEVRVLTFGIGQHCNWYFLKMLGLKSAGWSSGALAPEKLAPKMKSMITRASQPVLCNPDLIIPGCEVERVPVTVPDLFVGGPLVIAGRFTGSFPMEVTLTGYSTDGEQMKQSMRVMFQEQHAGVPLSKLFVKNHLDQLVAQHWLGEDPKVKQQIIETSINENLPTPHTTMVAYEMDAKQKEKMEKEEKKKKVKKKGPSAATIGKYAAGAVAITAGAVLVGSIAMTMSGGSGFGAIGDVGGLDLGSAFGGGCCDCCGDLFGGICGDFCGEICGGIGDFFGDFCGCFADLCGDIGGLLTDCSCCGEIIGGLGDCCGEVVGCIAECPIDEVFNVCIECLSGVLDAL